jgi:hypothetical protein
MLAVKKRIPDVAFAAASFALFMLSRFFGDKYAVQSAAASHGLPVSPVPSITTTFRITRILPSWFSRCPASFSSVGSQL